MGDGVAGNTSNFGFEDGGFEPYSLSMKTTLLITDDGTTLTPCQKCGSTDGVLAGETVVKFCPHCDKAVSASECVRKPYEVYEFRLVLPQEQEAIKKYLKFTPENYYYRTLSECITFYADKKVEHVDIGAIGKLFNYEGRWAEWSGF